MWRGLSRCEALSNEMQKQEQFLSGTLIKTSLLRLSKSTIWHCVVQRPPVFAGCLAQLLSENSTGSTKTELDLELQNFIMSPYPEPLPPCPVTACAAFSEGCGGCFCTAPTPGAVHTDSRQRCNARGLCIPAFSTAPSSLRPLSTVTFSPCTKLLLLLLKRWSQHIAGL